MTAAPPIALCKDGHDFMPPVVVRQGPHLLHASVEVAVSICRRCGENVWIGWTEEGDLA